MEPDRAANVKRRQNAEFLIYFKMTHGQINCICLSCNKLFNYDLSSAVLCKCVLSVWKNKKKGGREEEYCFLSTTLLPRGADMVCRSFSISTRWPNVINIQGWFLPDHGYFITDDKPCSGEAWGSAGEGVGKGGGRGGFKGWAQPLQTAAETDYHAFASASNPRCPLSLCLHSASVVRKIGKQWEWKKRIKLSKLPTQRPCPGVEGKRKKKESNCPPTWQNKWRRRGEERKETLGVFLDQALQLRTFLHRNQKLSALTTTSERSLAAQGIAQDTAVQRLVSVERS